MTEALVALSVALLATLLAVVYCVKVIQIMSQGARDERRELEDRLMSMTQPVALSQTHAIREAPVAKVTYMDEAAEFELQNASSQ